MQIIQLDSHDGRQKRVQDPYNKINDKYTERRLPEHKSEPKGHQKNIGGIK
jgi:hypothetical protein